MLTNLVIGSEGFVGKSLCNFLEKKGELVVHFDIRRDKNEDGRFAKLNLKNIDKIYFLAWDVGGAKYLYEEKNQLSQLKWNLALMTNIFDQIALQKKDFLFVSSQLAGQGETTYGVTKRLGEVWTHLLGGVSLRLWNVYGELEETHIKSHVVSDLINQAVTKKRVRLLTTGEEWRQFVHIDDVCTAIHTSLNTKSLQRSIFDVTSYHWIKIKDVAQIICDMTGAKLVPGKEIGRDQLNSPHMGKLPEWMPIVSLKEGIGSMVTIAKTKKNLKC